MSSNILQPVSMDFNVYARENPSVFFNSTTPAPLSGQTNITFQFDQFGNVSACTAGGGGGSSVGTAGQVQIVGSTAGSFAASSLTDNGTSLITTEPFTAGSFTSTTTIPGVVAGSTCLDWTTPNSRIVCVGPDSSTTASFQLLGISSTGTGAAFYIDANTSRLEMLASNTVIINNLQCGINASVGTLSLTQPVTATSATAGAATVLPVAPLGYVEVDITISGTPTTVKLPYYSV